VRVPPDVYTGVEAVPVILSSEYVALAAVRCVSTKIVSSVADIVIAGALQKCVFMAWVKRVPVPVPVRAEG